MQRLHKTLANSSSPPLAPASCSYAEKKVQGRVRWQRLYSSWRKGCKCIPSACPCWWLEAVEMQLWDWCNCWRKQCTGESHSACQQSQSDFHQNKRGRNHSGHAHAHAFSLLLLVLEVEGLKVVQMLNSSAHELSVAALLMLVAMPGNPLACLGRYSVHQQSVCTGGSGASAKEVMQVTSKAAFSPILVRMLN